MMNWKGNIRKEKTAQVDIVSIQSIKITWKVDRNQLIFLNIVDEQFRLCLDQWNLKRIVLILSLVDLDHPI